MWSLLTEQFYTLYGASYLALFKTDLNYAELSFDPYAVMQIYTNI